MACTAVGDGARHRVSQSGPVIPAAALRAEAPIEPQALAAGADNRLYIADPRRDQILCRLSNGRITVVAGTGHPGESGDAGPARLAEVSHPAGMIVAPNGTLFFADQGNDRVRAISPTGVIQTVAGGGHTNAHGFVRTGVRALDAEITPNDVTLGPHGRLYIATGEQVLRLNRKGTLSVVVGDPATWQHQGVFGIGGPAVHASADGANGIAFDHRGDLYVTGSNAKTLLVVTPDGTLHEPLGAHSLYPRGDGGVQTMPDGRVIAMSELGIDYVSPRGARKLRSFYPADFLGIHAFSPNGLAISRSGAIYLDTYSGNGFSDQTAIAEINGQRARLVWEGKPGRE